MGESNKGKRSKMLQGLSVLILALTVATAQEYRQQEYRQPVGNRRQGTGDEDANEYEYEYENGLQGDTYDEVPLGYEQGITIIDDTKRRVVADSPPPTRQRQPQPQPYIPRYQRGPQLLLGKNHVVQNPNQGQLVMKRNV